VKAPFSNFAVCFLVIVTDYYFMVGCSALHRRKSDSECQILRDELASKSCRRL